MPSSEVDPIAKLSRAGERLPKPLHTAITGLGDAAIPALMAVLENEELADAEHPNGGWAPIHAVDLLVDLRATAAIPPMLDILAATDFAHVIHSRIQLRLPELGAAVLEPALARLPEEADDELFSSLCEVLAQLKLKDERIYQALCRLHETEPMLAGMLFADYGDQRAVPILDADIRAFRPNLDSDMRPDMVDLVDSYETLTGGLPPDLEEIAETVLGEWEEARAAQKAQTGPAKKIGRNDPCPCGSGKKYKRCCQGA